MPTGTKVTRIESRLLHIAPNALLVIEPSGRISQINALTETLFGYPTGALAGQPATVLIPARLRDSYQQHATEYLCHPRPRPMGTGLTIWGRRQDGSEFAAEISLNPLSTPDGLHVVVAVRDVSEYRRVQRALNQATTELARQADLRTAELLQTNAELRQQMAERAQVEAALRETGALYRQLVENQPDLICRFLPDTTLTFVNAAYARFFQRQPEELLGQRFIEFLCAEDRAEIWEHLTAFTLAAPARQREQKTLRADGVPRWHLWHNFAFFDDQGKVTGFQSVGVDITERKRTEEALRQAMAELAAVFQALPDLYFRLARDGTYLDCLGGPDSDLRVPRKELLGKRVDQVLPPDLAAPIREVIERAISTHALACIEYSLTVPAGEKIFEARVVPCLDNEVVAVIRDITDRKRAEEALRLSMSQLLATLENTPNVAIQWYDEAGRVQYWNMASETVYGWKSEEAIGKTLDALIHTPEETLEFLRILSSIHVTGNPFGPYVAAIHRRDGSLGWVLATTFSVPMSEGRIGFVCMNVDITDRKRAEEALFEAKERAQVTLHSIGDAVITTDAHTIVDYLNPVAEALTGWTMAEAQGRPLHEVFRIVDEQNREPAADPVARCLQEGKIVGLANHSVLISRDGREYHIDDSAAPIRGRDSRVLGAVLVFHDVTKTRQLACRLEYDATHDTLTGLINRAEFERRLQQALASARQDGAHHALCYLDLDQFKIVNDTAGHAVGDELLRQIQTVLTGLFREHDTLARIGGDEFALLLDDCPLERAQLIAQTMVSAIHDHRFQWADRTYQIGVSIGLVPITAAAQDTAQILTQADVACYIAKELGRNRVHVYQRENSETALRHGEILGAAGLRDALEQGRFRLHYQPIISLATPDYRPVHYEALLRVVYKSSQDEPSELVLPAAFIPAAERYGLMGAIDRWVIQAAFREYAATIGKTGVMIAINLSSNSLSDETLLDFIEAQFVEFGLPPERVCFEITETGAIQNLRRVIELMTVLKRRGSQFALDDFGSGLSSFHYLKTLPVDYLKIDGSFVKDMTDNASDDALVAAINQMSHTLGIQTVAEYAHSRAIVERLRELGVDYAQGYFFGRPMPWVEPS